MFLARSKHSALKSVFLVKFWGKKIQSKSQLRKFGVFFSLKRSLELTFFTRLRRKTNFGAFDETIGAKSKSKVDPISFFRIKSKILMCFSPFDFQIILPYSNSRLKVSSIIAPTKDLFVKAGKKTAELKNLGLMAIINYGMRTSLDLRSEKQEATHLGWKISSEIAWEPEVIISGNYRSPSNSAFPSKDLMVSAPIWIRKWGWDYIFSLGVWSITLNRNKSASSKFPSWFISGYGFIWAGFWV